MTAVAADEASTFTSIKGKAGGARAAKNRIAATLIFASFAIALVPLVWLLWTVIRRGYRLLLTADWWRTSQLGITYSKDGGGALHAIVGTAEQVALCTVISVPIGLLVAIYLVEYGGSRISKATSFMVDILTGVPSIVAALFVYAVFITSFHGQRAGVFVALALVLLMVPVIVRTTEEMLKLVPNELREASYALGIPKWKTIQKIVVPTAFSGIVTGIMLGVARVAGETAPLLILVGYAKDTNSDLFSGFQGSLPGLMYSEKDGLGNVRFHFAADRMWAAALTLIIIVMLLNIGARLIARRSKVTH